MARILWQKFLGHARTRKAGCGDFARPSLPLGRGRLARPEYLRLREGPRARSGQACPGGGCASLRGKMGTAGGSGPDAGAGGAGPAGIAVPRQLPCRTSRQWSRPPRRGRQRLCLAAGHGTGSGRTGRARALRARSGGALAALAAPLPVEAAASGQNAHADAYRRSRLAARPAVHSTAGANCVVHAPADRRNPYAHGSVSRVGDAGRARSAGRSGISRALPAAGVCCLAGAAAERIADPGYGSY